jgi:hypothetical protein
LVVRFWSGFSRRSAPRLRAPARRSRRRFRPVSPLAYTRRENPASACPTIRARVVAGSSKSVASIEEKLWRRLCHLSREIGQTGRPWPNCHPASGVPLQDVYDHPLRRVGVSLGPTRNRRLRLLPPKRSPHESALRGK